MERIVAQLSASDLRARCHPMPMALIGWPVFARTIVLTQESVLTNRSVFWLSIAVAPLTLCIGTNARAAPTEAQQDAIRASCQSDYRSYCASVPTGGSAALQCLQKNVASLSPACQQAVTAVSGGATTTAPSATATLPPAGTGAPVAQSTVVLKPREEIALMRQACGVDYRAYCDGVRIVGGGALSCLVSHATSLSPGCKRVLGKLGQKF
jgi:hypothetical protein